MVGVGIGPPKVLLAPKPTSSVRISKMFGAPLGALVSGGKSMVESFGVSPMCPLKGGCGRGKTSCAFAGNRPDMANSVIGSVQVGIRRVKVKKFILSSFFLLNSSEERKAKRG